MKAVDQITFGCTSCGKRASIQAVVLTDAYTYIFVAVCECGAENHFKLNDILNSLSPRLVSEGSKQVN